MSVSALTVWHPVITNDSDPLAALAKRTDSTDVVIVAGDATCSL